MQEYYNKLLIRINYLYWLIILFRRKGVFKDKRNFYSKNNMK